MQVHTKGETNFWDLTCKLYVHPRRVIILLAFLLVGEGVAFNLGGLGDLEWHFV